MKHRVVRNYAKLSNDSLAEYGLSQADNLAAKTTPIATSITATILRTKSQALVQGLADFMRSNSPEDTARNKVLRADLIGTLDTYANDVENAANAGAGDPTLIAAYGFTEASTSHAPLAPNGTAILAVMNLATTKLGLQLQHDENAWCYLVEDTQLPNGPTRRLTFTNPDDVVVDGCTPGSMHSLRACTMAARNQVSEWCEPVQHMST